MERTLLETAHKVLEDGVPRYVWEPRPMLTSITKDERCCTITISPTVDVSLERPIAGQALRYRLVTPETAQIVIDAACEVREMLNVVERACSRLGDCGDSTNA